MHIRDYPYEKCILQNAAYDVLDHLNCAISFSDSRMGLLRFSHPAGDGEMHFIVYLRDDAEVTRVEVVDTEQDFSDVLLDEIGSMLRQCTKQARREAI